MGGMSGAIFKICDGKAWDEARLRGRFEGAEVDVADGYIHFSTGAQVAETAARHFRGMAGLVIVAFDAEALGESLKWEPSRGGELFPHFYGVLDPSLALWCEALQLDEAGVAIIPDRVSAC